MIEIDNNTWLIKTELTLKTVSTICKKFDKSLANISSSWIIDFEECAKMDCSGLSLIIEYIKHAQKHNIKLILKNLSQNTLSLAKVHGIKDILKQHMEENK